MGVVATEQIVIELCKETGEPGLMNNTTILGCLLDGIRDLSLHSMPSWDSEGDLPINAYNAVKWPCGMVKPLVTYLQRNGRALALDVDNSITQLNDTTVNTFSDANQQIQDFFRIDNFDQYYNTYNWGLGEIYGYGGGYSSVGVVTHDYKRRQSFIKGCTIHSTDTFGFFFKSDGLDSCPTHVPSECKEALEYFALGKYYRTRNPSLGAINRTNYKEEFTRLNKFYDNDDLNDWILAVNGNSKSSPK